MHAAGIFQLKEEVCLLKFSSSVSPFWSDFIFLHPEKQQQDMIHNTFSTVLCISWTTYSKKRKISVGEKKKEVAS